MEQEIWKDIKGFEGLYQISNLGRTKSIRYGKERILCIDNSWKGYCGVCLHVNNKRIRKKIHKLVAIAFLNHIPCKHDIVVDHIDGNPSNNCVTNLRLVTNRFNLTEGFRKDKDRVSSKHIGVCYRKNIKKWCAEIQINKKRFYLGCFELEEDAIKAYRNKLNSIL